ncbi:MAG: hypothetical protein J3K34DRAFT_516649 [Monoraphidium minutum]|nr:MAG: hypothetical protein J3K34DRAFT_516649 [Monoraphidium minutum]
MAAIDFFGYLLLGLGPGAAFYGVFIAPKSAFYWLVVLLFTSALFRGFEPLATEPSAYAGAVLAAVAIETAARFGVCRAHDWLCASLESMSRRSGHAFSALDRLHLALGWGAGHAACHGLFFFASLLPLAAGDGAYYPATCPAMSLLLVAGLNALGGGATLLAATVAALHAWRGRDAARMCYAPAAQLASALLTLGSFKPGGCMFAVPAVLALGAANTLYAAQLAWRSAPAAAPVARRSGGAGASSGGGHGAGGALSRRSSAPGQAGADVV